MSVETFQKRIAHIRTLEARIQKSDHLEEGDKLKLAVQFEILLELADIADSLSSIYRDMPTA